ncbi:MAG: MTAP family purine nucleoside phosphorylase, partial [Anaerolineaceae bacterium]
MSETPVLAVIGGTGLYQYQDLTELETFEIDTPFGKPSSPITVGALAGKRVAFLARHGIGHIYTPSEVNYRANIYAVKSLGIRRVVAVSACGSLREDYAPGHLVIPDQLCDFTRN